MKHAKLGLLAMGLVAGILLGFNPRVNGTIKGRVSPADGGNRVWIVSAADTLKMPIDRGSFEVRDIRPGTYMVIIEARAPYKNTAKPGIMVTDGQVLDLGEIMLTQ
jgi:hypothetical protein